LTSQPGNDMNVSWSADGTRVVYTSERDKDSGMYARAANGTGAEELLLARDAPPSPTDWSRDGRYIVFSMISPTTRDDLWVLPMTGTRKPELFLQTDFSERQAQFSPDGKWIAYSSDESGEYEIYVLPFPSSGPGGKSRISSGGGAMPRWRGDGRELFYVTPDSKMMAVDVTPGTALRFGTPRMLFQSNIVSAAIAFHRYAVTSDGQRFLINSRQSDENTAYLTVVLNALSGLKK
jgi:Tol biopolymer transport system component